MTYSIVARDAATGELGVAVQTRWFAVGAGVPWAEPGVGAVATQSFTLEAHGPDGLALLREGRSASEALAALVESDPDEDVRQLGIVDAGGRAAAHTGARCVPEAGHLAGDGVSVQANMMERPTVWPAMLAAYGSASGDLADRLMAALRAAEAEGGDVRGRQSAVLLVVPGRADAKPFERRFDLRVDDHRAPLDELARLLRVGRAYEAFEASDGAAEEGRIEEAVALSAEAHALAPADDQIALWHAVLSARAGRLDEARALYAEAAAAEPRAAEHLRRFARSGHLPEVETVLGVLLGEPR